MAATAPFSAMLPGRPRTRQSTRSGAPSTLAPCRSAGGVWKSLRVAFPLFEQTNKEKCAMQLKQFIAKAMFAGALGLTAVGLGIGIANADPTPTPSVPASPGVPAAPGVPAVPGVPAAPGVPSVPAAPGVPGVPGGPH